MLEQALEHRRLQRSPTCHRPASLQSRPWPSLPACPCPAAGPQPEITHLAWNRKVQHILGTCTAAGTVVVWDLKKQRPVISFKDPSGWGWGVGRNIKIDGWRSWLSCRSYPPCHA